MLTAAHCLFNFRTRQFIAADALHFLAGYRGGKYAAHARVAIYQIGTGFDPLRYSETFDNDWAVLTLTEPLPVTVAPFKLGDQAARGTKAMMAGYPQDRVHALTFDGDCELQERVGGGRLLAHTCRGASGFSGAPILVKNGKEMQVAGIQIARVSANGGSRMMAVPALAVAGADLSVFRPAPKPAAPATVIAGGPSKLKACNLSRPMELAALVDPPPPPEHPPGGMLLASIAVL